MQSELYLEVVSWAEAPRTPHGPPRLLIGDAQSGASQHLRFDLSSQALAPSPGLNRWARTQPLAYWRYAAQFTLELDAVDASLLDTLCSLARREGLTLLAKETRTACVVAGYLRDWAARTAPIEKRMGHGWVSSREAAVAAAQAADSALGRAAQASPPDGA